MSILDRNKKELATLNEILQLVTAEKALQTAGITSEIMKMGDFGKQLKECLEQMEPAGKNSVQQFSSKFARGAKDKERLNELMIQITNAKHSLMLKIQTAHVGLTMTTEKAIVANTEKIASVDHMLRELIEDFDGLEIAELVKDLKPRGTYNSFILYIILLKLNTNIA